MPKTAEKISHTFVYRGEADHSVTLVACFNKFHPIKEDALTRSEDGTSWSLTRALPPGRYEYKFLIDGERWVTDASAVESDADGVGGEHSVLTLGGGNIEDSGSKLVVQHDRGIAYSQ